MNSGSKDLDALRETASKALISLLWLHVPIAAVIGMARGTDWLMPIILMIAFAAAATLSWRSVGNGLSTHLVIAVALMGGVSVFTFQLSGHAWQVDSHLYFFAALASLAAYCDYRPIIAGTIAVALHHLALNFILPAAVYPGRRIDLACPQALTPVRDDNAEDRRGGSCKRRRGTRQRQPGRGGPESQAGT